MAWGLASVKEETPEVSTALPHASSPPPVEPHALEADVCRTLLSEVGLRFSSLVVRRVCNGVCLEGVLEVHDKAIDVTRMALRVAGVNEVQNNLLVRQRAAGTPSNRMTDAPGLRRPR